MDNEMQKVESGPMEMGSIAVLKQRMKLIKEAMVEVMDEGQDFGTIQGTPKPTLLKPGAEKLNVLFLLDPQYDIKETYESIEGGLKHYTVVSTCTLYHIPTGRRLGSGMGSCSTYEKKYGFRDQKRSCPMCHKETVNVSKKAEEGYYCWKKIGGCGATFPVGDRTIEGQTTGQVVNPDIGDTYNTILKMANKRSLVAATLNVTGASAIFTQDVEDMPAGQTTDADKKTQEKATQAAKPAVQDNHKPKETVAVAALTEEQAEQVKAAMRDCDTVGDLNAIIKGVHEANRHVVMPFYMKRLEEIKTGVKA